MDQIAFVEGTDFFDIKCFGHFGQYNLGDFLVAHNNMTSRGIVKFARNIARVFGKAIRPVTAVSW
ncbi:MAG: hypothetical protein R8J84_04525 [Mariprofundales bacterium]